MFKSLNLAPILIEIGLIVQLIPTFKHFFPCALKSFLALVSTPYLSGSLGLGPSLQPLLLGLLVLWPVLVQQLEQLENKTTLTD